MDLSAAGRAVLAALGMLCLAIGLVGVFVPLLPTTPFLLLALALFARSSPRFMNWLLDHRYLGPPVRSWQEQRAISRRVQLLALAVVWSTVTVTAFIFAPAVWVQVTVIVIGIIATVVVVRLPVTAAEHRAA